MNLADISDDKPKLITSEQGKILDSKESKESMRAPIEEEKEVADRMDAQEEAKDEKWPPSPRSPIMQERPPSQNLSGLVEEQKGNHPDIGDVVDTEG